MLKYKDNCSNIAAKKRTNPKSRVTAWFLQKEPGDMLRNNCAEEERNWEMKEKSRNGLYAALVVLLFLAGSLGTIAYLSGKQDKPLSNETALLTAELPAGVTLNKQQQDIMDHSVKILSNEAESEGVTVKLRAASGNAIALSFYVDVILPDWMDESNISFEKQSLYIEKGDSFDVRKTYHSSRFFEGDPNDHVVSMLVTLGGDNSRGTRDNTQEGAHATLLLEGLRYSVGEEQQIDENTYTQDSATLNGTWSFDLYLDKAIYGKELVTEPLYMEEICNDAWNDFTPYWYAIQIDSFYLHEQGASLRYQIKESRNLRDKSDESTLLERSDMIQFRVLVIFRDGTSMYLFNIGDRSGDVQLQATGPIPLDQVAYVVLNGWLVLPVS